MRRLDVLILRELFGPWAFGVAIFTVLIMAGTYLFKLTDYVVQGIGIGTIMELTVLLLPGIMAKTFPMAVLLATLLAFGRLSSDSEIVAIKACGTSLVRVMAPVAGFGFCVALLAFFFNEILVPGASLRATVIQQEIAKKIDIKSQRPTFYPVYEQNRLTALVTARDFNFTRRALTDAVVVTFDKQGGFSFTLFANELIYSDDKDWKIRGGGRVLSYDGTFFANLSGDVWPTQVPKQTFTPKQLLAGNLKDLDALSMRQIREQIDNAKANPSFDRGQLANLEFGYWNKVAVPLAALIYALVGAPLGVRNHRTSAASGFWLSVIIIFAYMMLANFMAIYAQGGVLPSWVASFLPLALGLAVGAVAIRLKNS